MAYLNILAEIRNRILFITINRPEKLNALNKATLSELHLVLKDAIGNADVGGLIITGAGAKAFVAGADISEFSSFSKAEGESLAREGHSKVFNLIENSSKPVIAAINGFALGGGLELALACHIRIASANAKMGLPETTLGLIPGYGGTQRLAHLVGKGRALEIILTANMISADEAYRIGLINSIATAEGLMEDAEKMMLTILKRSPNALGAAIRAVNDSNSNSVDGFETEISEFSACFGTADFKEGVAAFLSKREPAFKSK